jgi:hypothetical protein
MTIVLESAEGGIQLRQTQAIVGIRSLG